MAITINWARQMVGGKWQVNATGNDGETRLLKFHTQPTAPEVRQVVRDIEDREDAQRVLDAADRARLQQLKSRVVDFRRGQLSNAEERALLMDLVGELRQELRD